MNRTMASSAVISLLLMLPFSATASPLDDLLGAITPAPAVQTTQAPLSLSQQAVLIQLYQALVQLLTQQLAVLAAQVAQQAQPPMQPTPAPQNVPVPVQQDTPPVGGPIVGTQNASCSFNGQTVAHGASVSAYQASSVLAGQTCQSQTRVCSNGSLSGTYQHATCTVAAANTSPPPTTAGTASCTFNGQTVAHGATVTSYQANSVPIGSQCVSQTRSCSNGTLSGSYTYASCSVAVPQNLSMDSITTGTTVGHEFLSTYLPKGGTSPYTFTKTGGTIPPGITTTTDGYGFRIAGTNRSNYPAGAAGGSPTRSDWIVSDSKGASYPFTLDFMSYPPNIGEAGYISFSSNGQAYNQHPYGSTIRVGQTNTYAWSSVSTTRCQINWTHTSPAGVNTTGTIPSLASSGTLTSNPFPPMLSAHGGSS